MTAQNTVSLEYGEENTLTLSLNRKVMLIETVTMNNIPSTITAVSVTISPIYKNITLSGEYSGSDGEHTISLARKTDGQTWKNDDSTYLFEASGPVTIKVSLTTDSGTKSYSYSSGEELKANYKINISGTYNGNGITLSGTITGAEWAGTKDISFSFDESGSATEENPDGSGDAGDDAGDTADDGAPEVGTLYYGCYVLKSEKTDNGTVVTLMTTTEKNKLSFTKDDQTSIKSAMYSGIVELAVEGISGWRLPYLEELLYIKDNSDTINENLEALGQSLFYITRSSTVYSYYYLTSDGDVYVYSPYFDEIYSSFTSGRATLILRAFATVTFGN